MQKKFSRGQQQLICVARALLQTSIQILIIDEGTSGKWTFLKCFWRFFKIVAMDKQIDTLMQSIIRKHFAHCTVFTIAHSINTIEECDRIMVMENGHVVELDTPQNLISNTNSLFCKIFEIKEWINTFFVHPQNKQVSQQMFSSNKKSF